METDVRRQFWEERWERGHNEASDDAVVPFLNLLLIGGRCDDFEIPNLPSDFSLPRRVIDLGSGQASPSRIFDSHPSFSRVTIDYGGRTGPQDRTLHICEDLNSIRFAQEEIRRSILSFLEWNDYSEAPILFLACHILRYVDFRRLLNEVIATMSVGSMLICVDQADLLKGKNISEINPQGPNIPCNYDLGIQSVDELHAFLNSQGLTIYLFRHPQKPENFKLLAIKEA